MEKSRTKLIEEASSCGACALLTWTATHQPVMVDERPHHPGCTFVKLRRRTASVIGSLAVLGRMTGKPTIVALAELAFKKAKKE